MREIVHYRDAPIIVAQIKYIESSAITARGPYANQVEIDVACRNKAERYIIWCLRLEILGRLRLKRLFLITLNVQLIASHAIANKYTYSAYLYSNI